MVVMRSPFVPGSVLAALIAVAACDRPAPPPAATPAVFRIRVETSKGPLVIEARRDWAPNGADRLYELVEAGFFDNVRFFRVVPGFVVQFGIHGDPATDARWKDRVIPDDPVTQSNRRGTITFATAGPGTRTTQLFINLRDNTFLDSQGFSPVGEVVEGMSVVDAFHSEYGESPSAQQSRIHAEGNAFLNRQYPQLDYIRTARIVK